MVASLNVMTKAPLAFARARRGCCAFSASVTRSRGTKLTPRMVNGCSDRSSRTGGLHNLWTYLLRQPSTSSRSASGTRR